MKKNHIIFSLCLLVVGVNFGGDTLTQVSTIDALLNGIYDGQVDMKEMVKLGDFGIGTFHALDGEMVVLDSVVYKVKIDGTVEIVDEREKTPFAALVFFARDKKMPLAAGQTFGDLKKAMDKIIPSRNIFYAFKIEGMFKTMKTRSVPKQQKPYGSLVEIVSKEQRIFNFKDVCGVVVGFRCPSYIKGINVAGYHFHFLTADKKAGGHVLDFTLGKTELSMDTIYNFKMMLPHGFEFLGLNLEKNKEKDLQKVENNPIK